MRENNQTNPPDPADDTGIGASQPETTRSNEPQIDQDVTTTGEAGRSNSSLPPTVSGDGGEGTPSAHDPAFTLPPPPLMPDSFRYELIETIGAGGMGVVFKARDKKLNRIVALKQIRWMEGADALGLARFLAEAEATASVNHQNVVQVFDYGELQGRPYIALEYVTGGSLAEFLKRNAAVGGEGSPTPLRDDANRNGPEPKRGRSNRRLSPNTAADLVLRIARGVGAAHSAGIVHRDLKPANILLSNAESGIRNSPATAEPRQVPGEAAADSRLNRLPAPTDPKVTDFGLAKAMGRADMTRTDALLGTPAYMAPEQARGEARSVGPAADVWALGVILYECLTGSKPFIGNEARSVFSRVIEDTPETPRRMIRDLPRDLELICLKCLEKNPRDRYPTANELADDLERFLRREPVSARPIGRIVRAGRWCAHRPAFALTLGILFIAMLVLPPLLVLAWREKENLSQLATERAKAVVEAEARRETAEELARTRRYFTLLSNAREKIATGRAGWSWDARKQLAEAMSIIPPTRDAAELRTVATTILTGLDARELDPIAPARSEAGTELAVSPDGHWLAAADRKGSWIENRMRVFDRRGGPLRDLSFAAGLVFGKNLGVVQDGARRIGFTPDGKYLFVTLRSGSVFRWTVGKWEEPPKKWDGHTTEVTDLGFTTDGKSVYTRSKDGKILRWAADGDGTPLARGENTPTNRKGLAYLPAQPLAGLPAMLLVGSSAFHPETLAPIPAPEPLSPKHDLHTHLPSGTIYQMTGEVLQIIDARCFRISRIVESPDGVMIEHMAVSPDGTRFTTADNHGLVRIWDATDGSPGPSLHFGKVYSMTFVPNGNELIVAADDRIARVEMNGRTTRAVLAQNGGPVVALDLAKEQPRAAVLSLYTTAGSFRREVELAVGPADGGPHTPLRSVPMASARDFIAVAIAPDGSRAVMSSDDDLIRGGSTIDPDDRWEVRRLDERDTALAFGPTGEEVWSAEGSVLVRRAALDGAELDRWRNLGLDGRTSILSVAAGRTGVVAGCRNGSIVYFPDRRLQDSTVWKVVDAEVTATAFSPDESIFLVGDSTGWVRMFEVPSGKLLGETPAHDDLVGAVAVHPNNRLVVTGGRDRKLLLWTRTGGTLEPLLTLPTLHQRPAHKIAFTPDGRSLVVLHDGEFGVRVWRLDKLRDQLAALGFKWVAE